MSSIEKMQFVNIAGLLSELDSTLDMITESGCFHIESASALSSQSEGMTVLREENPYSQPLRVLADITALCGLKYSAVDTAEADDVPLGKMNSEINSVKSKIIKLKNEYKDADEKLSAHSQALFQVEHLLGTDVDFRQLFSCQHVKIRFGKLPVDSFAKLGYYSDKIFYFHPFSSDEEYYWGVYFTPVRYAAEIDGIFDSLYYERIRLPDFVHANSEDAVNDLKEHIERYKKRCGDSQSALDKYIEEKKPVLDRYYTKLRRLHDSFDLRSKASVVNNKFLIIGFVPESEAKSFESRFEKLETVSVVMNPSSTKDRIPPPIKLKNGKFSEPFGMFTEMYGLPDYNGMNPTTLVAVTYTILFGIMFADLGQGLCVALIGLLLWKLKNIRLGAVMTRLGLSGAVFGTLFGSVFGMEELLDPVYESLGISFLPFKSMENINTILYGAIGIGVVIIVITMLINIIIRLKEKNFEEALFANNGVAGLVFFAAIVYGLVSMVLGNNVMTTPYVICLLILPFVMMFMREPLGCMVKGKKFHLENGVGDFIASNFFECFEFLLGYATNTLSFVRVGGFVLSHAGMMAVVMSLSEMSQNAGSIAVLVLGNIFVMCLEGMLVGIQVLRLEFYEIFSRFYSGDGKPFVPVRSDFSETVE